MSSLGQIEGLRELQRETIGDRRILVAVLDGPVDREHACFVGARLSGCEESPKVNGKMLDHGTHVASVLFGQPDGPLHGVAPGCAGSTVVTRRLWLIVTIAAKDTARPSDLRVATPSRSTTCDRLTSLRSPSVSQICQLNPVSSVPWP